MRIFMFTSQAKADLHAFAGDEGGTRLPEKYAPWGLTGALGSRESPPHRILAPRDRAGDLKGRLPALADEAEGLSRARRRAAKSGDAAARLKRAAIQAVALSSSLSSSTSTRKTTSIAS